MKFKILDTTDSKYEGEVYEASRVILPNEIMEYKDTSYKVEKVEIKGDIIKLYCANYTVIARILEA